MYISRWLVASALCGIYCAIHSAEEGVQQTRQPRPHRSQDCATPDGLRQILCDREDTSHMCRFFDAQTEGAAFQLPSLGSGVTIFVMVDAAIARLRYMSRASALAQTIRALSSNDIPDAQRISMRMYLQLPEPLEREELVRRGHVATVLSEKMPKPNQFELAFSQTGDGQVEITSMSPISRARILDSFEVCSSWIHTVDGLILPSPDNSVEAIPAFKIPKKLTQQQIDADSVDFSSQMIAGGLLGGIAALLGTLCFQGMWVHWWQGVPLERRMSSLGTRSGNSGRSGSQLGSGRRQGTSIAGSNESDIDLQESMDRAIDRALDRWAGDNIADNKALRASSRVQDASKGLLPGEDEPAPLPLVDLRTARSQGLPSTKGTSPVGGTPHSAPVRPSLDIARPNTPPPAQRRPDPEVPGEQRSGSDEPSGASLEVTAIGRGSASSPEGPLTGRQLEEFLLPDTPSPTRGEDAEEEVTWESVQAVFDRGQDRSWQLQAEDLTICLRPDGSDWILGSGGYGRVYKGILHGSTPVAIKFITRQTHREKLRFLSEIHNLKNLRHVNITQFMGAHVAKDYIVLACEYMSRGNLWDALNGDAKRQFSWYNRGRQVALDVVCGLVFMHSKSMVHLDLKTSNILLSRDGTAKIADVGLARILTRANAKVSAEGTFEWAAPEVLQGQDCSDKADIYSLGVVLWEIITGDTPHQRRLRAFRCPEEVPADVGAVVDACRAVDPSQRPSARQLFAQLTTAKDGALRPNVRSLASAPSDASLSISLLSSSERNDTGDLAGEGASASQSSSQPVTIDLQNLPPAMLNSIPEASGRQTGLQAGGDENGQAPT